MTVKGHILLASSLAYPLVDYIYNINSYGITSSEELTIYYFLILLGSITPDIDEPKSYIGRKLFFISNLFKQFGIKHRTITHWLIIPIILLLVGFYIHSYYLIAFSVGIFFHSIGDLITNTGIRGYLYPILPNTKIVLLPMFLRFDTFSITESILNVILTFLNLYLYGSLFTGLFHGV